MDITPFLEAKIAPRAIFDTLEERRNWVRFYVPRRVGADAYGAYDEVTYGQFAEQTRDIALGLVTWLASGDRACIFAPNSVAWAASALAIQAIGGVMVPIYAANTEAQVAYVVSHSDAKVVFVDTEALLSKLYAASLYDDALRDVSAFVLLNDSLDAKKVADALITRAASPITAETAARLLERTFTLGSVEARGRAAHAADADAFTRRMSAVSLDAPGLMLYTSGTSGNPKGVPLTHRNIAVNGRDWLEANGPHIPERCVDILWLPMSHIFGFGEMGLGNTLGFSTYMSDPQNCIKQLATLRPHIFMSVPSHWEKLAALGAVSPEKLREVTGGRLAFCLSGGAGLKREVKEQFWAAGMLIIEGYGLTETSPTLTMNRREAFRFDSVGRPFPSVQVKLAEDGEILAKGPTVFGGYHKDAAATREAFTEDGWFKTGDVGRFTEDGFLQIVDRKKDILVTAGGKNVAPQNIELRFQGDADIAHVVVYGDSKKFLVAGVWLLDPAAQASSEAEQRIRARIEQVNQGLASFETIKKFALMDRPLTVENELLTASFKVRRKKVYEAFRPTFEALYADGSGVGHDVTPQAGKREANA
jgi:long-chain acyl-CoA synthetase